ILANFLYSDNPFITPLNIRCILIKGMTTAITLIRYAKSSESNRYPLICDENIKKHKLLSTLIIVINTKVVENSFCSCSLSSLYSATYLTTPLKTPNEVTEVINCVKL